MIENPFTKPTFESVWLKHFKGGAVPKEFKSVSPVKFFKDSRFPLHINVGKNITNGIYYNVDESATDYKGKTFLMYDVPSYFDVVTDSKNGLKLKKSEQFKGFVCDLKAFDNYDQYLKSVYKKSKNRSKFRRNFERLEANFDVEYKLFHGTMSSAEYEEVFHQMIGLIKRRFDSLGLDNNIVAKKDYYYDLCYDMVLNKEALFFATYADGEPVGISFMFTGRPVLFAAITTFDVDFKRYNLGHITIIKMLQWCFDNDYQIFDFSKGEYEYKIRWSNHPYRFHNHILYDSKSFKSRLTASLVCGFFDFKQFLRDRNVNFMYNRFKYFFKSNKKVDALKSLKVKDLGDDEINFDLLDEIHIENGYEFLKEPVLSHIFIHTEPFKNIKFYKKKDEAVFYALGNSTRIMLFS